MPGETAWTPLLLRPCLRRCRRLGHRSRSIDAAAAGAAAHELPSPLPDMLPHCLCRRVHAASFVPPAPPVLVLMLSPPLPKPGLWAAVNAVLLHADTDTSTAGPCMQARKHMPSEKQGPRTPMGSRNACGPEGGVVFGPPQAGFFSPVFPPLIPPHFKTLSNRIFQSNNTNKLII